VEAIPRIGQHPIAGTANAAQIDLRFCDVARALLNFGGGAGPDDLTRGSLHLFTRGLIGTHGDAQSVAERVSRHSSATLPRFRAGTGPRVFAVRRDLARTGHDRRFGSAGFALTS
jgi:hypothetical protein